MKARKGFAVGCISSVLIVIAIVLIILISNAGSYDGECISFEPPARKCSFGEYIRQVGLLILIFSPFTDTFLFCSISLVLLFLPILGWRIGTRLEHEVEEDPSL
jgi:hypothetical protein